MKEIISLLLNVSRIDMGVISIAPKKIDLIEIMESALHEQGFMIQLKKITVNKIYDKNIPMISADTQIVKNVFHNLLSNAVKYAYPGGKIEIEMTRDSEDVFLRVEDNGCGIPIEDQGKIFNKLFRTENAMRMDPKGNGLGLYVARELLNHAGGKIWFRSAGANKGAVFYVTIPLGGMITKVSSKRS